MAESLGAAVLTVTVDQQQFTAGLNQAKSKADSTVTAINGAFAVVGRTLAGLGAGLSLGAFLQGSVQSAIELESITRRLTNTLGPQGAAGALSFTKGLSDQLGISFKTLSSAFGSFTAAATAANVPIDQQRNLFAAVAKAGQSLGLSNDEINGSLLALQQVASKGNVQMEELRGQLGERLPIAFAATAKGLGITQQQLIKLVESGQLTSAQFFPALTKGLNELTAGASGAPTTAQNLQKLANAWDELQTAFGQNLLPTVTRTVEALTGAIEGLSIGLDANKLGLGGLFGFTGLVSDQAIDAVQSLKLLQQEFNLTDKQARSLFFDAAQKEGLVLGGTGFVNADAKSLEKVFARLPELAEAFRARNKDTTAEIKQQEAAAAALLERQRKLTEEEQKRLDARLIQNRSQLQIQAIQQQIDAAKALATAEGTSLVVGQNRLAIENQVNAAKIAQLELDRELAKPVGNGRDGTRSSSRVDELLAKVEQANKGVELAYAEAGASLLQNARSAADALQGAQQNIQSVLRGGFNFLTPALQQQQIERARASIQPLIDRGIIRQGINVSTPDQLFNLASFAQSFTNADNELIKAQNENTKALNALAGKDTNVTVVVNQDGNRVFSEVLTQAIS